MFFKRELGSLWTWARERIHHGNSTDQPHTGLITTRSLAIQVLMQFKQVGSIHGFLSLRFGNSLLQHLHHLGIAERNGSWLNVGRAVALQSLGCRTEAVTRDITVTAEDRVA